MNENQKKALEHISFSRMTLWFNSRKSFHKKYILGQKSFESAAMAYGKHLDAVMSQETAPKNDGDRCVALEAPDMFKYTPQKKLTAMIECDGVGYPMIGFVDFSGDDDSGEQKSGTTPSCYGSARSQLGFYDLIRLESGVDPQKKGWILWIPTQKIHGRYHATGEVKKISTAWDDEFIELQRTKVHTFIRSALHTYG